MDHKQYQYIDPFVLFDALGGDLEFFRSLSQTFLEIAPPMFERLERALKAGDATAASFESHALKGTAALSGAKQLTNLLSDIESLSRRGEGAVTSIAELTRLFGVVMQEVDVSLVHFMGDTR